MNVDGTWGNKKKMSAVVTSVLELLDPEEEDSDDKRNRNNGDEDEDDDSDEDSRRKRSLANWTGLKLRLDQRFSWRIKTNMTTSLPGYEDVKINFFHTQSNPLRHKTDLDIQVSHFLLII